MHTSDELEAMKKPELIALGQSLSTPVLLDLSQKKGDMVVAILRATGQTIDTVAEAPKAEVRARDLPSERKLSTLDGAPTSANMYRLTIHATENDRGRVPVTINGYKFDMERDIEHVVPEEVVDVLRNSKINTVRYNPQTRRNEPATIMTYPIDAQRI
jgi:hypothetical protein